MIFRVFGARSLLFMLLACGWVSLGGASAQAESASDWINRGNRYYAEERYQKAIEAYRHALQLDPTSPVIQYNLGTALARSGSDDDAIKALSQATQSAEKTVQKRDAWFNLGVAEAESGLPEAGGQKSVAPMTDPQQQIEKLTESVKAFRQAILADPDDLQAKHNYELTLEQLEKLRQQQQQQQKNDQNQKNQDQNQQDDKNKQQQDQQKNDQQQNDQQSDQQQNQDQDQQQKEENKKQNEQQDEQDEASQQKGMENEKPEQQKQDQQDQQQTQPQDMDQNQGETGQSGQANQEQPLTPDQMNALRMLNLLEKEKPEQFKKLFQFKGSPSHKLEKDW